MNTPVPVRLQRSRAKGARLVSPNGLPVRCCSRPGRYSNPFRVGDPHPMFLVPITPGMAVKAFRDAVNPKHHQSREWFGRWAAAGGDLESLASIRDGSALVVLRGCNLACWCKLCDAHRATGKPLDVECPDCAPCHVDPLGAIVLANGKVIERRSLLAREA